MLFGPPLSLVILIQQSYVDDENDCRNVETFYEMLSSTDNAVSSSPGGRGGV